MASPPVSAALTRPLRSAGPAPDAARQHTTRRRVLPAVALAMVVLAAAWYLLEHGGRGAAQPLQVPTAGDAVPEGVRPETGPEQGAARAPAPPPAPIIESRERFRGSRSPLSRLRPQQRAELEFLDKLSEVTADGRLRVFGRVTNSGGRRCTGSRVRVWITGDGGRTLAQTEVPVQPSRLGPGETGTFEAFFPDPATSVGIKLELNWVS